MYNGYDQINLTQLYKVSVMGTLCLIESLILKVVTKWPNRRTPFLVLTLFCAWIWWHCSKAPTVVPNNRRIETLVFDTHRSDNVKKTASWQEILTWTEGLHLGTRHHHANTPPQAVHFFILMISVVILLGACVIVLLAYMGSMTLAVHVPLWPFEVVHRLNRCKQYSSFINDLIHYFILVLNDWLVDFVWYWGIDLIFIYCMYMTFVNFVGSPVVLMSYLILMPVWSFVLYRHVLWGLYWS